MDINNLLAKFGFGKKSKEVVVERVVYTKFKDSFSIGDVIMTEPEYGNQYFVLRVIDGLHELRVDGKNDLMRDFVTGMVFYKVASVISEHGDPTFDIGANKSYIE